jgi:hypothetical protein
MPSMSSAVSAVAARPADVWSSVRKRRSTIAPTAAGAPYRV